MTRDDIIRMAREAGSIDSEEVIATVWAAFTTAEREECAKVCEVMANNGHTCGLSMAAAIRARSEK